MRLLRVSNLTSPPTVGQVYLVPCVPVGCILTPIIGPAHTDVELGFEHRHYHYDWRFIGSDLMHHLFGLQGQEIEEALPRLTGQVIAAETGDTFRERLVAQGLAPDSNRMRREMEQAQQRMTPVFRAKRCVRDAFPMPATFSQHIAIPDGVAVDIGVTTPNKVVQALESVCADRQIANLAVPVCPHKGMPLKDQPVEGRGQRTCVTCPLHGLRWSLVTGKMISHFPMSSKPAKEVPRG